MRRHDEPRSDDYLWDRSGKPDPDVLHLERLLASIPELCPIPDLRQLPEISAPRRSRLALAGLAVAATIMLAVGGAAFRVWLTPWTVETVQGNVRLDARSITATTPAHQGQIIETDAQSRAMLRVGAIGRVDIAPGSRVRVIATNGWKHRLALERGRISAVIDAPPRWFIVDTPGAVAIDLGCAYTLDVDAAGDGTMRVDEGWVELELGSAEAIVPAGAAAQIRRGRGPGSPYYADAGELFQEALAIVDFGSGDEVESALSVVLSQARLRDALTLLSLLRRVDARHRGAVYDRLAVLLPPPAGVVRDAIVGGDRAAMDRWWEALALPRPRKLYPRLWGIGS